MLVLAQASIKECQSEGHVILNTEKAGDFYIIANELNLLTTDVKHRIMNGGPIDW